MIGVDDGLNLNSQFRPVVRMLDEQSHDKNKNRDHLRFRKNNEMRDRKKNIIEDCKKRLANLKARAASSLRQLHSGKFKRSGNGAGILSRNRGRNFNRRK